VIIFAAARGRVCSPSHLITTAEVLLRADLYEAVEAVVNAEKQTWRHWYAANHGYGNRANPT